MPSPELEKYPREVALFGLVKSTVTLESGFAVFVGRLRTTTLSVWLPVAAMHRSAESAAVMEGLLGRTHVSEDVSESAKAADAKSTRAIAAKASCADFIAVRVPRAL